MCTSWTCSWYQLRHLFFFLLRPVATSSLFFTSHTRTYLHPLPAASFFLARQAKNDSWIKNYNHLAPGPSTLLVSSPSLRLQLVYLFVSSEPSYELHIKVLISIFLFFNSCRRSEYIYAHLQYFFLVWSSPLFVDSTAVHIHGQTGPEPANRTGTGPGQNRSKPARTGTGPEPAVYLF